MSLSEFPIDYSTIDLTFLRRLPEHKKPPTYKYGSMGQCCYLDAPGYPSYFVQHVYTGYGNDPSQGARLVIHDPETKKYHIVQTQNDIRRDWKKSEAGLQRIYRKLWKPLPLEHERVQAWIRHVYAYQTHCYATPWKNGKLETIVFPPSKIYLNEPILFAEELAMASRAVAAGLITPENYLPVVTIREFYPDHAPNKSYMEHTPEHEGEHWWETSNSRLTIQELQIQKAEA